MLPTGVSPTEVLPADVMSKVRKLASMIAPGSGANDFERITAQGLLDKILKPHGFTRNDLSRLLDENTKIEMEVIQLNCNSKLERVLGHHCVMTVVGREGAKAAYLHTTKQRAYYHVTEPNARKIEQLYLAMRKDFRRQVEILLVAFVNKHKLFGPDHVNRGEGQGPINLSPEEQAVYSALFQAMPVSLTLEEIFKRSSLDFDPDVIDADDEE